MNDLTTPSTPPTTGSPKKVFIVEDDTFIGNLVSRRIIEEHIEVSLFTNGEDFLNALQNDIPHLIILDILLPGMNGLTILQKIREDARTQHVPVFVLSNVDQKQNQEQAQKLNAEFYVKALMTPDKIAEHIKRVLA